MNKRKTEIFETEPTLDTLASRLIDYLYARGEEAPAFTVTPLGLIQLSEANLLDFFPPDKRPWCLGRIVRVLQD